MRSRSFLLHDSHLTCSIHHRELADTRAPQQIKSLSIIPAYIVILMAFLAASCGGATTTKPHAEAIGLRWGVTQAQSTVISVPMKDEVLRVMPQMLHNLNFRSTQQAILTFLYIINSKKVCSQIGLGIMLFLM